MDLGLEGRVAIVTAASKGLGRATAQALATEGARVLLNARNEAALDEVAATMDDALVVPGDITDPALPARLVDAAIGRWGRPDVAVANAGGPPTGGALDVDDEQILAAINANLLASVRLARAAVPHMRRQRWGRVVFIAWASVRQPIRDLALSNVARTGLWAWTKTAAQDLVEDGVTVNLAAPACTPPTGCSSAAPPAAPVTPPTSARPSPSCAPSRPASSTAPPSASTGRGHRSALSRSVPRA